MAEQRAEMLVSAAQESAELFEVLFAPVLQLFAVWAQGSQAAEIQVRVRQKAVYQPGVLRIRRG